MGMEPFMELSRSRETRFDLCEDNFGGRLARASSPTRTSGLSSWGRVELGPESIAAALGPPVPDAPEDTENQLGPESEPVITTS